MTKLWVNDLPSLRSWSLRNFKSVTKTDIDLAPMTLVVGANSAGKSTLLQSILLMAQASADVSPGGFPLNGPLVGLGKFEEALTDIEPRADNLIRISGELVLPFPMGRNRALFREFDVTETDNETAESDRRVRKFKWSVGIRQDPESSGALISDSRVSYSRGQDAGEIVAVMRSANEVPPEIVLRVREVREKFSDQYRATEKLRERRDEEVASWLHGNRNSRNPQTRWVELNRNYGAVSFMGGFPFNGLAESDEVGWFLSRVEDDIEKFHVVSVADGARRRQLIAAGEVSGLDPRRAVDYLVRTLRPEMRRFVESYRRNGATTQIDLVSNVTDACAMLMSIPDYMNDIRPRVLQRLQEDLGDPRPVLVPIPMMPRPGMRFHAREIAEFFDSSVVYLGPLREDPRVTYPHAIAGSSHMPLGRKGESTASVLLQSHSSGRRSSIRGARSYPLPAGRRTQSLEGAVTAWVKEFGLGQRLDVQDEARHGVGFTIDRRDLTSVGTGVSQILPVIVLCLMARPGQLVLLEQPELHLNPALQQNLADFFLVIARSGRQLLVETHSEYLVTRLRRRVVEDDQDEVRRLFNIVFAEQDDQQVTNFRVLDVDPGGALGAEEWPKGFFDQAGGDVEVMMRLALARGHASGEED